MLSIETGLICPGTVKSVVKIICKSKANIVSYMPNMKASIISFYLIGGGHWSSVCCCPAHHTIIKRICHISCRTMTSITLQHVQNNKQSQPSLAKCSEIQNIF